MWLLLIGQPLFLVCKPLSFFHFEVGGTWAHSKKNFDTKNSTSSAPTELFLCLSGFILSVSTFILSFILCCVQWQKLTNGIITCVLVPVQIHMSNDSEFLTQISKNHHNSDSDDSADSELDCSAVVENSDTEDTTGTESKQSTSSTPSTSLAGNALSDAATQQAINVQILAQLSSISDRLNVLESKKVKKHWIRKKIKGVSKSKTSTRVTPVTLPQNQCPTSGMPSLQSIRQDAFIQSQVDQRLRDLAHNTTTGTKLKSLRGGPVEVLVSNRVKWPQEFVLSGFKKERIQYDQLSVVQWVAGFCRILREEQDPQVKEHILDYLIALMEDANDFSWDAARASHAVLLCRMEQGEVKNYTETEKLDRIRRANAQRHVANTSEEMSNFPMKTKNKVLTCSYYNQGTCIHQKSHDTKGVTYRHICAYCFQQFGKTYSHSEQNCRSKTKKMTKNE